MATIKGTKSVKKDVKSTTNDTTNTDEVDESELCDICCTNCKNYTCPSCKCKMCNECLKTFVMEYSNLAPHCMQCQALLPFIVIYDCLGKKGLKEFFKKSAGLKFELELQKAPDSMPCCNEIVRLRRFNKIPTDLREILCCCAYFDNDEPEDSDDPDEILKYDLDEAMVKARVKALKILRQHKTNDELKKPFSGVLYGRSTIMNTFRSLKGVNYYRPEFIKELEPAFKLFTDIEPDEFRGFMQYSPYGISESSIITQFERQANNKSLGASTKVEYIFKCSNGTCKGLVDNNYKCQLCRHVYCKDCFKDITNVSSTEKHVCNPDDVLTAQEIMNSTKPCPNCGTRIFKISGCSQMFCTHCHTGFDWNTGKIITSNFHNPHRLEWLRERGMTQGPEEIDCDLFNDQRRTNNFFSNPPYLLSQYQEYNRRTFERNYLQTKIREYDDKIRKLDKLIYSHRCYYLLNELSKDDYTKFLGKNVKDHHRLEMIVNIYRSHQEIISTIMINSIAKYRAYEKEIQKEPSKDLIYGTLSILIRNANIDAIKGELNLSQLVNTTPGLVRKLYDIIEKHWMNHNLSIADTHVAALNTNTAPLIIKYLRTYPSFEEDIKLMDKITEETCKSIDLYKSIFGIAKLTKPVMSTQKSSGKNFYGYYEVA